MQEGTSWSKCGAISVGMSGMLVIIGQAFSYYSEIAGTATFI
jgi:hypothetical protein